MAAQRVRTKMPRTSSPNAKIYAIPSNPLLSFPSAKNRLILQSIIISPTYLNRNLLQLMMNLTWILPEALSDRRTSPTTQTQFLIFLQHASAALHLLLSPPPIITPILIKLKGYALCLLFHYLLLPLPLLPPPLALPSVLMCPLIATLFSRRPSPPPFYHVLKPSKELLLRHQSICKPFDNNWTPSHHLLHLVSLLSSALFPLLPHPRPPIPLAPKFHKFSHVLMTSTSPF